MRSGRTKRSTLEQAQMALQDEEKMREKHADLEDVSWKCATPLPDHLYVRSRSGETVVAVLAVTTSHRALARE
jgi:hypothetical protein